MRCSGFYQSWTKSCLKTPGLKFTGQRARFLSALTCSEDSFTVPIGNNGSISLSVTRPTVTQNHVLQDHSQGSNVILYLPPGPVFRGFDAQISASGTSQMNEYPHWIDDGPLGHLSSTQRLAIRASAIVVTINYRLGRPDECSPVSEVPQDFEQPLSVHAREPKLYQFPTPVHDTLAGFDWVQTHLKPAKLGIFGSQVGGSLALMLALTEARSVHAVAAASPICDWSGLDEHCTTQEAIDSQTPTKKLRRTSKKNGPAPWDLIPLLQAREQFFATPEQSFDAFASPVLLLRSAGRDVPKTFPQYHTGPDYPVPILKDDSDFVADWVWDRDAYPDIDSDNADSESLVDSSPRIRRRKALSRWPPYGLDYGISRGIWSGPRFGVKRLEVTLPWIRLLTDDVVPGATLSDHGSEGAKRKDAHSRPSVLAQQGEEMVSVLRRACFWGQEKGVGERRVTLSRTHANPADEAGRWFDGIWDKPTNDDDY